jgi:hypothetical protein
MRCRVQDGGVRVDGVSGLLPGQVITFTVEEIEILEECLQQLQIEALAEIVELDELGLG